jgi:small subunit ribosomal protein S20
LTRWAAATISAPLAASVSPPLLFCEIGNFGADLDGTLGATASAACHRTRTGMANTTSAKKAARQMARRTIINKARRSRLRNYVGKVEDAIASGDRTVALAALGEAEPVIMRAAQLGIVHKNSASRKVSRLTQRVAELGK